MAQRSKIENIPQTHILMDRVMDRRQLLEGGVKLGVGVALVGALPLLSSCDMEEASSSGHKCAGKRHAQLGKHGNKPAPEAEILVAPHAMGDVLEDQYRLVGIERAPDGHLQLHLQHVKRGGALEVEIFRRAATTTRPIAATAHWEMYSFNTNAGPIDTPAHVKDVIAQVALIVAMHEDDGKMQALNKTVCTFEDRVSGPPKAEAHAA